MATATSNMYYDRSSVSDWTFNDYNYTWDKKDNRWYTPLNGSIVYPEDDELKESKRKEKLIYTVLEKVFNELILKEIQISSGLKYEITSLLEEIIEIEKDDGFIKEEEMVL